MGQGADFAAALPPHIQRCGRFGIAGGLTPENVHEALSLGPHVVDVSSGVESSVGRKDPEKVRAFVARCRA